MKYLDDQSALLDFLLSFELGEMIEEWDDGEKTLLEDIVDHQYMEIVKTYVLGLSQNTLYQKFVTKEYNLLLKYFLTQPDIRTINDFLLSLQELSLENLKSIIASAFDLPEVDFTLHDLEKTSLSSQSKWEIFLLLTEFDTLLPKLIDQLRHQYQQYQLSVQLIIELYDDKFQVLQSLMSEGDQLYSLIFEPLMDRTLFDQKEFYGIFPLSLNRIFVQYKVGVKRIALGLYVYDYYDEKQKRQLVDEQTTQQILKVLADQTRYGIIKCIVNGITSNKEIAKIFSISPSGVTYQLKFLVEHDILQKDEVTKHYRVNTDLIQSALSNILLDLDIHE